MTELIHTNKDCTAWDICLGGTSGLFCGNCGAGTEQQQLIDDATEGK